MANEPPAPIAPSMFEVQARLAVKSPSSLSFAVAANEMASPTMKLEESTGVEMITTGTAFAFIVMPIAAAAAAPPLSFTDAVTV